MPRTLTERQLLLALLARQHLLERAKLPLPRALEGVGGIQAQYAPSSYIGLWSRLAGFERAQLTRALETKAVVQGTLMRATIHLVSARDWPGLTAGIRDERRQWWLRAARVKDRAPIESAAERTRALVADGPRKRAELQKALGVDNITWMGVGMWLDLVRVPPSGTWEQRRADLFAAADDWLGALQVSSDDGLDLLLKRYLGAFGPSPLKDAANWAGLTQAQLAPAAGRVRLRRFRDEHGAELLDLPGAPIPDEGTPVSPRFLPMWDATLLVHARRTQILPERFRPRVFSTKTPQSVGTFLIDGRVAGTWKERGSRVEMEAFARLQAAEKRALEEEAHRLEAFIA